MINHAYRLSITAAGALLLTAATAHAASDPTGIWFDHNGRGAVEISPCASGGGLCGYVVHIKDAKNAKRCGTQILGNVTPSGGGWIYSPDRGRKYSVALSRLSDDKLRVVGNAGSFFSKTFTWNRAPDDLARCGETTAETASAAQMPTETVKPAKVETKSKAKDEQLAEDAPANSEEPNLDRSSSASLALLATPRKRVIDAPALKEPIAVEQETIDEPAPAADAAPKPKAKQKVAAEEPAPEADNDWESSAPEPKRMCKFKIPYVGRVISVPCRD